MRYHLTRFPVSAQGSEPEPPSDPTWYEGIASDEWGNIGSSWRSGLGNYSGTGGAEVSDVGIFSYSGMILVTTGVYIGNVWHPGSWLVLRGGGHEAYNGNELAGFGPLTSDSPSWQWVCMANPVTNVSKSGNQPASDHSYAKDVYDSQRNRLIVPALTSIYSNSAQFSETFAFDFGVADPDNNLSTAWSDHPTIADMTFTGAGDLYGAIAVYDSANDRVIFITGNGQHFIGVLNCAANTWTRYPTSGSKSTIISYSDRKCPAIDPVSGIAMVVSNDAVPVLFDTRNMANEFWTPSGSNRPSGQGGVLWDPIANRFVYWAGGNTLHFCPLPSNPYEGGDNYNWTSSSKGGDTVDTIPTHSGNGIWNRFRYCSNPRSYVGIAGYNRQVAAYRPAA